MKHNWKIPYRELGVMMALQFFIAINHLMFFNKNSEKAEKHAIFFGKKKKSQFKYSEKVCVGSKGVTETLFFAIVGPLSIFVSKTNESGWK